MVLAWSIASKKDSQTAAKQEYTKNACFWYIPPGSGNRKKIVPVQWSQKDCNSEPSAALPWEAQMLCWLAFGEHEALEKYIFTSGF